MVPAPKIIRPLPVVLSPAEVVHFLECVPGLKHRAILTTCYAAGLRIAEAVRLTISANLQRLAQSQLGNQRGAVVLLDTHTGAILAMYSTPSIDLAALAGHNPKAVQDYFTFINNDPSNPSLPRAYRETFPPGSSFKIVTAAVANEDGKAPPDRQFPVLSSLKLPQTTGTLSNFGSERCGGNLLESFVHSCNTTFGQLGLDLGDDLVTGIERFGIDQTPHTVGQLPWPLRFGNGQQRRRDEGVLRRLAAGLL